MNNSITIVPSDHKISVNGEILYFYFPCDPSIHAIQWKNGAGEIEYVSAYKQNMTLEGHADYNEYVKGYVDLWHSEKIKLEEKANKPPSTEELIKLYTNKVQERLDDFARSEGKAYDNMLSACTYATSTNPIFSREGQYCVEARDNTWATAYQIMNDSLTGQRPIPSWEEIEAELPDLAWPNPIEENTNA